MNILQILVLIYLKNYYLYYALTVLFTIIESIMINSCANKMFPELKQKTDKKIDVETQKEITKNVVALTMHKVGGAVIIATDCVLISAFLGGDIPYIQQK